MEPIGTIEWQKEYESGIEEIDQQHKDIINTLNEIYFAIENREFQGKLSELLDAFDFYVTIHLNTEENYAEKYDFPKIIELKESHEYLRSTYKHLQFIHKGSEKECISRIPYIFHLHSVMREWLGYHLVTLDKELFDFLREKLKE
ncbi:MAG: hypothetical protein A2Y25_06775 [Candidatus Melainabacteria bacterium GWF2_37_15]|nr:MAG: hypothetical protein A2Y25_06775 [Candidatus Melainabacteria bacterium GWF2_37_15]